jgi:hypothetical protein
MRTTHGDFSWYHTKYNHDDAKLTYTYGRIKTPEHLVNCRKVQAPAVFKLWPQKLPCPPTDRRGTMGYLLGLLAKPADFAKYLGVTEFYSKIYTRF